MSDNRFDHDPPDRTPTLPVHDLVRVLPGTLDQVDFAPTGDGPTTVSLLIDPLDPIDGRTIIIPQGFNSREKNLIAAAIVRALKPRKDTK
ncbi:hypothetical protein [Bifidobacterium parmae]|uniref:Uncharacterized protein n=1 Tax=Bifidobacterium parmae TaxID=361854 RepID=A0A2N5IVM3_9BIFI|nr:hypothetical protein [Bifidobacterium parmae]PLS26011.1 hypothetical protein Uis4E_2186 [Bifidobacterium parmae]